MILNQRNAGHIAAMSLLLMFSVALVHASARASKGPPRRHLETQPRKSTYRSGTAPRMQVRRIETRLDGFGVFTLSGQDYQGNPIFIQSVYKLDGKGYPEYNQTTLAEFAATGKASNIQSVYSLVDPYTVVMTDETPLEK
jgi:hypothetical protein